jgi:hypothetical protein
MYTIDSLYFRNLALRGDGSITAFINTIALWRLSTFAMIDRRMGDKKLVTSSVLGRYIKTLGYIMIGYINLFLYLLNN